MSIKFDQRNYRKHDQTNKDLIKKSLEECGAGRSIVIDNEDEIIAGNGIYEQAKKLGIKTKIIETDGTELVVVKRTDLATNDEKRKQLAIMDNSTSDSSEFDLELLQEDFEINVLNDWGVDFELDEVETDTKYSRKIDLPIYEIKGEKPKIKDLIDTSKADALIEEIEKSNINNELKAFLKQTATRLYEFKYSKIAEFYAHQEADVQSLMEKQALVLIDLQKAVENGYVELNEFINTMFLEEGGFDVE